MILIIRKNAEGAGRYTSGIITYKRTGNIKKNQHNTNESYYKEIMIEGGYNARLIIKFHATQYTGSASGGYSVINLSF